MKNEEIANMVENLAQLKGLTLLEALGVVLIQELQELNTTLMNSDIAK